MEAKFLIFSISCLLIFICSPYFFYDVHYFSNFIYLFIVVFVLFDACINFYAVPSFIL